MIQHCFVYWLYILMICVLSLSIFDDLFAKVNLLTDIINRRFKLKQISTNRRVGVLTTDFQGRTIPLDSLSSGEQHQLVMMYELICQDTI